MSKKWLWLTIGVVVAGFLVVAIAGRNSAPKQSEVATPPRPAPAPAPLSFRERKERRLLTSEEQRIVDEVEKMKALNREYENKRQVRLAREEAEKKARWERQVAQRGPHAQRPALTGDELKEEQWLMSGGLGGTLSTRAKKEWSSYYDVARVVGYGPDEAEQVAGEMMAERHPLW